MRGSCYKMFIRFWSKSDQSLSFCNKKAKSLAKEAKSLAKDIMLNKMPLGADFDQKMTKNGQTSRKKFIQ